MTQPLYLRDLLQPHEPTADDLTAQSLILSLIEQGYLIGVEVFGTDGCCEHGDHTDCESTGYGLCDMFGPHSVGSDCNRATKVLMRPSDALDFPAIAAALTKETHE